MRDRLINLLDWGCGWIEAKASEVADYLLENGVIVLPCGIGTDVYCLARPCGGCKNYNEALTKDAIEECRNCDKWEVIRCKFDYDLIPEYGKLVFPTPEQAEQALADKREMGK